MSNPETTLLNAEAALAPEPRAERQSLNQGGGSLPARSGSFPTHETASRIAEAARDMGYRVRRSAASAMWRTAYVFCGDIKVRVADHPNSEMPDIDVHVGEPRPGAVDCNQAIEWLRGRL